jgi:hypothetical protein
MRMSRVVTAKIEFEFYPDEDELIQEGNMSSEELIHYYKELVLEDIMEMSVRYPSDLFDAVVVEGV